VANGVPLSEAFYFNDWSCHESKVTGYCLKSLPFIMLYDLEKNIFVGQPFNQG
jgi:hypothetical protein